MKIVIENHIPYIRGIFEPYADVAYLPPHEITPDAMSNADALITRTRTRCDRNLLSGSRCGIIATATIGTDHIDTVWCADNGIKVVNAPGCNAPAVAQYVLSSVLSVSGNTGLKGLTIGIVGVGHVGSIVQRWASGLGMNVLLNDPPRADTEGYDAFVTLEEIAARADIITFHTPSTSTGKYPTFHLAGDKFFKMLKKRPVIINSARGPVADTVALINAIDNGQVSDAVIDCWENEPAISNELLQRATIATPHIAGYSKAGKIRATIAAVKAVATHLGIPAEFNGDIPADAPATVTPDRLTGTYDPMTDTQSLKSSPDKFEYLRNNYELRREP